MLMELAVTGRFRDFTSCRRYVIVHRFGEELSEDSHFQNHLDCGIPVQVYYNGKHADIGLVESVTSQYVKINDIYYARHLFTFISRPGY